MRGSLVSAPETLIITTSLDSCWRYNDITCSSGTDHIVHDSSISFS